MSDQVQSNDEASDFEKQASSESSGTLAEIAYFLRHNKKWWLLPLVLMLLMVSALVLLSGTAMAPFIYTLF